MENLFVLFQKKFYFFKILCFLDNFIFKDFSNHKKLIFVSSLIPKYFKNHLVITRVLKLYANVLSYLSHSCHFLSTNDQISTFTSILLSWQIYLNIINSLAYLFFIIYNVSGLVGVLFSSICKYQKNILTCCIYNSGKNDFDLIIDNLLVKV